MNDKVMAFVTPSQQQYFISGTACIDKHGQVVYEGNRRPKADEETLPEVVGAHRILRPQIPRAV